MILEKFKSKKFTFGEKVEFWAVKEIMENRKFLISIIEYLNSDFFESRTASIVVDVVKTYFKKYADIPPIEIIQAESKNFLTPKDDIELFNTELKKITELKLEEGEKQYVKDNTVALCQYNALKLALYESAEILLDESGDIPTDYVGTINEKIKKAVSIAEQKDLGLN